MKLSRLSNRQLRRLLARGEVRFGMAEDGLKDFIQTCIKIKRLYGANGVHREYRDGLRTVEKYGFKIPSEAFEIAQAMEKLAGLIESKINIVGKKIGK